MLKKILILALFILFTYSLFACVKGATPRCSFCGDTSLRCLLSPGWNTGVAQADEEWYGVNCGEDVYTQLEIRATEGDYSLCKIEDQEPRQCPALTDTCVVEGVAVYLYQGSDETYWVLAHRISGDPGFEIHLYCSSGPPPATAVTTSPILSWDDPRLGREGTFPETTTTISTTTTIPTHPSSLYENYSLAFWMIVLVIIIVTVVFLYKFGIRKEQEMKIDF